jgi:hypothetical protein
LVRPLPHRFAAGDPATSADLEAAASKTIDGAVKRVIAAEGMCASRSTGGPDPFGYTFIDSTEPGGPAFDWVELSGTGTQVVLSDEEFRGPFQIGFPFSFYDRTVTQFFVQSNGAITFDGLYLTYLNRCPLPDLSFPRELIAPMWDDLDPGDTDDPVWFESFGAGACPYDGYPGPCLVVEFEDFCLYPGGPYCAKAGTFELILLDDDSLVMQYLDAGDEPGFGSTTGLQSEGATFGLTYSCNLAFTLTDNLAIRFERTPPTDPVVLTTSETQTHICPRTPAEYTITVLNNTGGSTGFDVLYSGFDWSVSGEATLGPLGNDEGAAFELVHRPPDAALPGATDTVTVTVQSQSGPESATVAVTSSISRYVVTSGPNAPDPRMDHSVVRYARPIYSYLYAAAGYSGAYPLPKSPVTPGLPTPGLPSIGSVTPEATVNLYNLSSWYRRSRDSHPIPFPGDMAQGIAVSGEAVLVAFPDATGISDLLLHIYELPTDRWYRAPLPVGFPPNGIWGHDIACADVTNTCYITGGATSPGGGDLTSLYAYDVSASTVTSLPPLTSPRAHHASFLLDGMLCIAGGIDASDTALSSTQCYDLAAGTWHPENAGLGPLPGTLWGMADAVMEIEGVLRPVMAGGVFEGGPPGAHFLWHDGMGWQYDAPFELGVYRTEAATVEGRLSLVGGSTGGLAPTNALQTLRWCPTEAPANDVCASAIELPPYDFVIVSNEGATDSGPPLPSCADYQGGDVWVRVTVPAGEEIWIHTSGGVGSPIEDTGMAYYAECPHQVELECNDDAYFNFSQVGPVGPGTYWVRVWEKGNDAFGEIGVSAGHWIPVELTSFTVE